MGVYRPHEEFLRLQIQSILTQDHSNLLLYAIVDGLDLEAERQLANIADPRLRVVFGTPHLGTYLNFGRGLEMALARSGTSEACFAFADQDDIWEPQKLSVLVKAIQESGSVLAFCDAQVIDENGKQLSPSLHKLEGRMTRAGIDSILVANPASGMSMLFTRKVAECACPFPKEGNGIFLHDWWVSAAAASNGPIIFVDRPLVQYRRHAGSQMGARISGMQKAGRATPIIAGYRYAFQRRAALAECLLKVSGEGFKQPAPLLHKFAGKQVSAVFPLIRMGLSALLSGYTDACRGAFRSAAGAALSVLPQKHR
jgi:glycosyltransferase involved in cell wall biosynthesis